LSSIHHVDRLLQRLDDFRHQCLALRRTHVEAEATYLCRNVLDTIPDGSVRRPDPRLAVGAGQLIGGVERGPQRGRDGLSAQGLGPLRLAGVRSAMTSGQSGYRLDQFAVRCVIVVVVVVVVIAGRGGGVSAALLLVLDTTAAPLMDWV